MVFLLIGASFHRAGERSKERRLQLPKDSRRPHGGRREGHVGHQACSSRRVQAEIRTSGQASRRIAGLASRHGPQRAGQKARPAPSLFRPAPFRIASPDDFRHPVAIGGP